jgi:hypothetical protein
MPEPTIIPNRGREPGSIHVPAEEFLQQEGTLTRPDGTEVPWRVNPQGYTLTGGVAGRCGPDGRLGGKGGDVIVSPGVLRSYPHGLIVKGGQPTPDA